MKVNIKGYICPKKTENYSDCVDRYGYNLENNSFAISDGVTNSFYPGIWAELLISNFIDRDTNLDFNIPIFLESIRKEWFNKVSAIAECSKKWAVRKNFKERRPGLATFVGLNFSKLDNIFYLNAIALGDSFLFYIPKAVSDSSFDLENDDFLYLSSKSNLEFDNYPDYFSSVGLNKGNIKSISRIVKQGTYLLMTDALSEWFIKEKTKALDLINNWDSHEEFINSIDELRTKLLVHNDDSAILIITVEEDNSYNISYTTNNIDDIHEYIKMESNVTMKSSIELINETNLLGEIISKENISNEANQNTTNPIENTLSKSLADENNIPINVSTPLDLEENEQVVNTKKLEKEEKKRKQVDTNKHREDIMITSIKNKF